MDATTAIKVEYYVGDLSRLAIVACITFTGNHQLDAESNFMARHEQIQSKITMIASNLLRNKLRGSS